MASETLPQEARKACACKAELQAAQMALNAADTLTREATESIVAIVKAAQKMLELDANALVTVFTLLDQIRAVAGMVQDQVGGEAENVMACHFDADRHALISKLHAQQAMLSTASVEVVNAD